MMTLRKFYDLIDRDSEIVLKDAKGERLFFALRPALEKARVHHAAAVSSAHAGELDRRSGMKNGLVGKSQELARRKYVYPMRIARLAQFRNVHNVSFVYLLTLYHLHVPTQQTKTKLKT